LPGRTAPDRAALLHQLARARLRSRRIAASVPDPSRPPSPGLAPNPFRRLLGSRSTFQREQREESVSVDVRSEKLARLVDESVEVKQLGTGFTFTEGPIWNPEEQFLLFSDMPGDTRRRWDEANGVEEVLSP